MLSIILKHSRNRSKETVKVNKALIIGRGAVADINLDNDKFVSRLHTLVVPRPDDRLEIRDLSSKMGTFVIQGGKEKRLMPEPFEGGYEGGRALLSPGDKFSVGGYQVEIYSDGVPAEPTMGVNEDEDEITGIEELDDLQ